MLGQNRKKRRVGSMKSFEKKLVKTGIKVETGNTDIRFLSRSGSGRKEKRMVRFKTEKTKTNTLDCFVKEVRMNR
jgi:hypothetical protein